MRKLGVILVHLMTDILTAIVTSAFWMLPR